jgi:hypothetical protein
MHVDVYRWLIRDPSQPNPPAGVTDQDIFEVKPPTSDLPAPSNVKTCPPAEPDKIREARVFPDPGAANPAGTFGLINLDNSRSSASADLIEDWILKGASDQVLASWEPRGFTASPTDPLTMGGQSGLQASQARNLESIIGQPRVMPVYTAVQNPGSNAEFQVVGFVGVTVCDVKLTGGPTTKHLTIQITGVADSSGWPPGSVPPPPLEGEYIYAVSLVR